VQRAQHSDELVTAVAGWIAARDRDEVLAAFTRPGGERTGLGVLSQSAGL
jgi:hypothetical protein